MNSKGLLRSTLATIIFVLLACLPRALLRGQPIYSVNTLGYADADCRAGSNLLANPFFNGDNTVSNLFRGLPDGSFFLPLAHGSSTPGQSNYYSSTTGWTSPGATFLAPDAGFLWLPSARRISFVGTGWSDGPGPGCLTYSGSTIFSGWFPQQSCGLCEDPENCPPDVSDGTWVQSWNRVTQSYDDASVYYEGLGWVPSNPVFGPTEGVRIDPSASFGGRSPFAGSGFSTGIVPTGLPWTTLSQPQRVGTNLVFNWPSLSNTTYAVFCSTNLNSGTWQLAQHGVATPTGGLASVSLPATDPHAFYRVLPYRGAFVAMLGGARVTSTFSFQLWAPAGTNYTVQRKATLSSPSWLTLTNFAAGPSNIVTVVDGTATAASGYYRVYY